MRRMLVAAALLCGSLVLSQDKTDRSELFRQPALSRTQIAFHYGGDLWIAPRAGGEARRLTAAPGSPRNPHFSPDGEWIAFTGEYDGNIDAFVVPSRGGVPRRLTWHPAPDVVTGWSADGTRILFRSPRNSYSRFNRLFTLALDGGVPEELPLHMAEEGSFSSDGSRIAYVPLSRPFGTWKRYRGGQTNPIWIARLSDSSIERIPRENSNDFNPMWIGDRIYFLSDRNGPTTLFYYDTKSRRVSEALPNSGLDLKNAAAGPGAIAYEQFGGLHLFDLKSQRSSRLDIKLSGDMPEVRRRLERLDTRISAAGISPTGARAVFEARAELFTVPAEKGDVRNLTNTPGVAERDPAWSPDGKWIAYLSDASGEYELQMRDQTGRGEVRSHRLSSPAKFYYSPTWSPDSRKIAFTDRKLNVAYLDVGSGKTTVVDTDRHDGPRRIGHVAWSPDSRWLAYTKQLKSTLRAVFAYSLESRAAHQVTDGMSDATLPVFDRDGKHMYFVASTDTGLSLGWRDMSSYFRPVTSSVYAVVLRRDLPSPLEPESDEEKAPDASRSVEKPGAEPEKQAEPGAVEAAANSPEKPAQKPADKTPAPLKIDFDRIEQRILALPIPPRDYTGLHPGKAGVLFLEESPFVSGPSAPTGRVIHKYDLKTRKVDKFLEGVRVFELSANGEKVLFQQGSRWTIAGTGQPPRPNGGVLKLDGMETWVEPRAEWRQMYREASRIQRDFFYDPGLHGVNMPLLMARYEPYLDAVSSRGDLSYLLGEMMGEFTASHLSVAGGAQPEARRVRGGLLGADYDIAGGRYRFKRVYSGEGWNPDLRAPLTQPGVNVVAGEYLLAVGGRELRSSDSLFSFFEATAGKQVTLKIAADPGGAGARNVTVIPLDNDLRLRNLAWIEGNRRKVDEMSGGRLAYVYLPDTALGGYTYFNRYYFAQAGKQGAVIDERFNAGGSQPDYIVDYMRRPLMHYRTMREGEDITGPQAGIFGPKAMLINEYAGSGGDTLPWYFRKAGIGPLIGKRTWGGLVGGLGGWPPLMDGGVVTPPSVGFWDPDKGEWVAENVGIAPDVEVEQDPKAMREGRDPQLERAVEVVLEALRKNPPSKHTRPPFPSYHKPQPAKPPTSGR